MMTWHESQGTPSFQMPPGLQLNAIRRGTWPGRIGGTNWFLAEDESKKSQDNFFCFGARVRMKGAAYSATGLGSVSCKAWGKLNLNSVEATVDERSEKKSVWKDGWNWNLMSENSMGKIWVGEICFSKGKHVNMLEDREMEWNGWNPLCQKWKNNHEESSGTQTHPFSQLILMIIY